VPLPVLVRAADASVELTVVVPVVVAIEAPLASVSVPLASV